MEGTEVEWRGPVAGATLTETFRRPAALKYVWVVLGLLVFFEAVGEVFAFGGSAGLSEEVVSNVAAVLATCVCLARAAYERRGRYAWLAFGAGLACWTAGSLLWTVRFGGLQHAPYPSASDALWLAWYPLTGLGVGLLIRLRITRFELHRWIDGVAVMLIVLAGGFALVLGPVAAQTGQREFATIVDFSYPVLDMVLIGAILGVFGLMAWRPGKVWVWLGIGCVSMAAADAVFAVQEARGTASGDGYGFIWTAGLALIAYAAWVPLQSTPEPEHEVRGWSAIALPLAVQLLAVLIQLYLLVGGLNVSIADRVVTVAVLLIASLQIVVSRPRVDHPRGDGSPP